MRFLVFGAGAIGSVFAGLLARGGRDVTLLARGERLRQLGRDGLRLIDVGGEVLEPPVEVVGDVPTEAEFDYVLVCVRADQVGDALPAAARAKSPTIVPMVNHASGYDAWAEAAGAGRLMVGFPGAGGAVEDDGVHYGIPSKLIEETTLGELNGSSSERLRVLAGCLEDAGFNVATTKRIDAWQRYHAAYISALLLGIGRHEGDVDAFLADAATKREAALAIKEGFAMLGRLGFPVTPSNLLPMKLLPARALAGALGLFGRNETFREMFATGASRLSVQEAPTLGAQIIAMAEAEGIEMPNYRRLLPADSR